MSLRAQSLMERPTDVHMSTNCSCIRRLITPDDLAVRDKQRLSATRTATVAKLLKSHGTQNEVDKVAPLFGMVYNLVLACYKSLARRRVCVFCGGERATYRASRTYSVRRAIRILVHNELPKAWRKTLRSMALPSTPVSDLSAELQIWVLLKSYALEAIWAAEGQRAARMESHDKPKEAQQ